MRAFACVFLGVLFLALPPTEAAGQAGTLTGVVQDQSGGRPVPSVQVFIADLNLGGLTQQNGRFLIQNVPAGTHMVTAERLGYRSQTQTVNVAAGQTVTLNWTITEEAIQLDEVIVTGTPGGTRRRAIGNSVAQVDAAEITQQVGIRNMQDLLTARVPGLQFQRLQGNVGQGSNIYIRGISSLGLSPNPLIYVDGVRVDNSTGAGPALAPAGRPNFGDDHGRGAVNVLADFNPADIESIEIIKGPAAATLYGTEASAGVIQIITKRGVAGAAQWDMSVRMGGIFTKDPARKMSDGWVCTTSASPPCPGGEADLVRYNLYEEASKYISGEVLHPDGGLLMPTWPADKSPNLYQTGLAQNYDLSVRGGTEGIGYYFSANWTDEEGKLWWNTNEAKRVRANISAVLAENLSVDVSTGYMTGNTRFGEPIAPELGIYRDVKLSRGRCLIRLNLDDCPRFAGFTDARPDDLSQTRATRDYDRFVGSVSMSHTPTDWLTQRFVVGTDLRWETNERFFPRTTDEQPAIDGTIVGELDRTQPQTRTLSFDYSANAAWQLNPTWRFTTSTGAQFYREEYEELRNFGRNFASSVSTTINQTSIQQLSLDFEHVENKSLGFYVQEEVAWNDRLFLTGAVRFDDNSAFGKDFDAQIYPKVSAAWVISEESFWNFGPVNSLRLRGAWGKAGRQPNQFSGIRTFAVIPGVGGDNAFTPENPGNPEVGPEISDELELGFEIALLDDRIAGDFTYYTQHTKDLLIGLPLPPSFGFAGSVDQNVGSIDNWGWEAQVDFRVYQSEPVSFDLSFIGSHSMNEIKSLGDFPGSNNIRVGAPYPNFTQDYKVVSAELVDIGRITNVMCDSGVFLGPDNLPDAQRMTNPGGAIAPCSEVGDLDLLMGPAFFTYTWTIAPRLRLFNNQVSVFATVQGNYGRTHTDHLVPYPHLFQSTKQIWLQDDPLFLAQWRGGQYWNDSSWAYDGDFWRVREIGATWQIPAGIMGRLGADRASLAVSARDMFIPWRRVESINGVNISDPEHGGEGPLNNAVNFWHGPPNQSFDVTLRVSF